jgi:hypothetical protein
MKNTDHQSLRSGAPSQSADLDENPSEREKAEGASRPDRLDEAAPQHAEASGESGNPPGADRSIDRGMASPGVASQADASARHASENLPELDRTPKR